MKDEKEKNATMDVRKPHISPKERNINKTRRNEKGADRVCGWHHGRYSHGAGDGGRGRSRGGWKRPLHKQCWKNNHGWMLEALNKFNKNKIEAEKRERLV